MRIVILVLFSILILASKCKEDPPVKPIDQLPPITTTGENTFGCLINGEVWLPKGYFPGVPRLTADWNNGGFSINANCKIDSHFSKININGFNYYKAVELYFSSDTASVYVNFSGCMYHRDSAYVGSINFIHLDTINRIMSGTFWFKTQTSGCAELDVTDGRFDINY